MRIPAALIAATFLVSTLAIHAQETPAAYRVEFDVHNAGNQPSQHFSMLVDDSRKGNFQALSRVPIDNGSPQYVDVGANIECTVHESEGKAVLSGSIELTSITGFVNISAISEPIIGQRKWLFHTTVDLATLAVIVDDRDAVHVADKSLPAATAQRVEAKVTKVY
jgi:hypothetical protein